jgi:hypothetical protein
MLGQLKPERHRNHSRATPRAPAPTLLAPTAARSIDRGMVQEARAKEDAEEAAQQTSLKAAVEDRREHIKEVVRAIKPDLGNPDDAYFINAEWLTKWANTPPSEELPAISNSELVCEHDCLDPQAWDSAKRISGVAWQMLQSQWGGGPALTQKDLCVECTNTTLEEIVQKCDAADRLICLLSRTPRQ